MPQRFLYRMERDNMELWSICLGYGLRHSPGISIAMVIFTIQLDEVKKLKIE